MEHDQPPREPKHARLLSTLITILPYFISVAALLGLITAITLVVIGGYIYRWEWTGFIGKTLWDWMKLLVVPIILALGGLLITQMERLNAARAQRIDAERLALEHEQAQQDRKQAHEQLRLTREGQITERFTRTIEQLGATDAKGEKRIEPRVGAIYALEQISRESDEYYWPIMEILTSYVRQHTTGEPFWHGMPPPPDIYAILTVLRRRPGSFRHGEPEPLNLRGTELGKADLRQANLARADLSGARPVEADLSEADLSGANLSQALFFKADLSGADLSGANLWEADLSEADLSGADLSGAQLQDVNLTQAQLDRAIGDEYTQLPSYLKRPAQWGEKPNKQAEQR